MKQLIFALALLLVPYTAFAQTSIGIPVCVTANAEPEDVLGRNFVSTLKKDFVESGLFRLVNDESGLVDVDVTSLAATRELSAASVMATFYKEEKPGRFARLYNTHYAVLFGTQKVEKQAHELFLEIQKTLIELARKEENR